MGLTLNNRGRDIRIGMVTITGCKIAEISNDVKSSLCILFQPSMRGNICLFSSKVDGSSPGPYVEKLVVAYRWSAVNSTEP